MPIYLVQHTSKVVYQIVVLAENEEEAMSSNSYDAACQISPNEHFWHESEVLDDYDTDDPNAPEVEFVA